MSTGRLLAALALVLGLPTFAACADDPRPVTRDDAYHDAGARPPTPATPPAPTPAPTTPPSPSNPPATPATPATPGTPPPPPPTPAPTPPAPAPAGSTCMASTTTCLEACMDDDCFYRCVDADPACSECLDAAFYGCVEARGCTAQLEALDSCGASCTDDACWESTCAMQIAAFDACLPEGSCDEASGACFGASP